MIDKNELGLVLDAAAEVYNAEGVLVFLRAPSTHFHGNSALDLLDQGDGNVVLQLLDALASGAVL